MMSGGTIIIAMNVKVLPGIALLEKISEKKSESNEEKKMARIPLLREDDPSISEEERAALASAKSARGRLFNLYRAMANHPQALQTFTDFANTVYRHGSLTPVQAELAYTTATVVNNCHY